MTKVTISIDQGTILLVRQILKDNGKASATTLDAHCAIREAIKKIKQTQHDGF